MYTQASILIALAAMLLAPGPRWLALRIELARADATSVQAGDNSKWDSGNLVPGASFSQQFVYPGAYTYECVYHYGMTGTVTVTP